MDGARGRFFGQEQLSAEFPTKIAVSHRQAHLQFGGRVAILTELRQSGNMSHSVLLANESGVCYS